MRLTVAGGSYFEKCLEPYSSEFYGSGLRAAAALSKIASVELATYAADEDSALLDSVANTFGIEYSSARRPQSVRFEYEHPLATPIITPHPETIDQAEPLIVKGARVLRFGFLEGDAVLDADAAVYDPQSPVRPQHFAANGSRARRLAVIANAREASRLSEKSTILDAGAQLLSSEKAEVVVVKQGSLGCLVFSRDTVARVPVFQTTRVWPIGSGDVFSATFFYYWAEAGFDPFAAAEKSSLATAFYCDTQQLPIPLDFEKRPGFSPTPLIANESSDIGLVYLAGPFFTMSQRHMVNEARRALQAQDLNVFSPFHDVGPGPAEKVGPADIEALERSSIVFALLDGLDPGTIFEVGYARKKNIPVIALAEQVSIEDLKMFKGTGCQVVDDFSTAVYRTSWAARQK